MKKSLAPMFELDALESRVLMSAGPVSMLPFFQWEIVSGGSVFPVVQPSGAAVVFKPAAAHAHAAAPVLSLASRYQLLSNWSGSNYAQLKADLDAGNTAAFDQDLLDYMVNRTTPQFYWSTANVDSLFAWMQTNLHQQADTRISAADLIVAHDFPGDFGNVQLPAGTINWNQQPAGLNDANFLITLNAQAWWPELAFAYRYTGNVEYLNELTSELTSWSQQAPPLSNPNAWAASNQWYLLSTSQRAYNWVWTYFTVLGSSGWTGAMNTLFLQELWQHGNFLATVTPPFLTNNWTLQQAVGLRTIAENFPEFTQSAAWQTYSTNLMWQSFGAQFYADGGDTTESLSYQSALIVQLLDQLRWDQDNAMPWTRGEMKALDTVIQAYYQLLSPDGTLASLNDTYRENALPIFTQIGVILGSGNFPVTRPRLDDAMLLGTAAVTPALSAQDTSNLPDRGQTYAMPLSGFYVMRSDDTTNARQIIFDAGPKGGTHGHFGLFTFELYGYGKALIANPGPYTYDNSPTRNWVISTPAQNTISIDGQNVEDVEGVNNPKIHIDSWNVQPGYTQITAHHYAYEDLAGSPVVARSLWFNNDDMSVVVDWGSASASHTYTQSFNLPGTQFSRFRGGSEYTTSGSGDVLLVPILMPGQTATLKATDVYNAPPPAGTETAMRYTVNQTGKTATLATVIVTFTGSTPPNVTATWLRLPGKRSGIIQVVKDGVTTLVYEAPPSLKPQ